MTKDSRREGEPAEGGPRRAPPPRWFRFLPTWIASGLHGPEDRTRRRLVQYAALTIVLVAAVILVRAGGPIADPWLYTNVEVAATALALALGALALVRYYSKRDVAYLYIGTGFLGTALLEGYHAVVTAPPAWRIFPQEPENLLAWSGLAARIFLALFLFASWWASRPTPAGEGAGPGKGPRRPRPSEASVFLTAGGLTVLVFVFFGFAPLSDAYSAQAAVPRPWELLPGAVFLLALAGYLHRGQWRRDGFEDALVTALVLSVFAQWGFLAFSREPYDLPAMAGQVLRVASYGAVGWGLLVSVYHAFRLEESASTSLLRANAALAREMEGRRKAERGVHETEERLKDFLDHAHDLIQSTAPGGRILYVNEAWKRTLGYDEADLEEIAIEDLVHPDSQESFTEVMAQVFSGRSVRDFQVTLVARDGSKVVCSGSSNARFEDGRPVATRSILRNVTEQRNAAEELARFEASLQAVFESTGDAIWSVGRDHRLLTCNTAYALLVEVITGRTPQIGDRLEQIVGEEALPWFVGCYERGLTGTRFSAVREERVDGQLRTFELFFNPIEAIDGPAGVVVFSRDVTRRRRVEEALRSAKRDAEEASRTKSQFLANMSHELRTPLNSIIGFANILLKDRGGTLPDKERGFMERIAANGRHLLHLINDILDLSKIEAGRMEVEPESVDLRQLAAETLAQMEGQVGGRAVTLRSEAEGDPVPFQTDRGKLKQILINLVGNALKSTEEGEVVVRIETADDGRTPARILVRDSGIGIPDDRLQSIFQAFQQADAGTARRFGGTGLGLTICRSLCDLLGYGLSVESAVGEGSTFTIEISPIIQQADTPELGDLDQPPTERWAPGGLRDTPLDLQGRKILVVDDEEDSRALLTHYLEDLGCRVIQAKDGIEGLEVARREQPDLITADLMMPRMSGWEMLRAAREDPLLRDVPVVVVSIVAEEGGGQVLGAVDLLSKPVDREELSRILRRNLVTGSARVLVVEDNPDSRLLLQRYLRDAGLSADAVANGAEALAYIRRTPVDLILLDLMMPVMSGLTLLERIRASPEFARIPVVVLTARDLTAPERSTLRSHGVRVIQKGAEVERHLRHALDQFFGAGTAQDRR